LATQAWQALAAAAIPVAGWLDGGEALDQRRRAVDLGGVDDHQVAGRGRGQEAAQRNLLADDAEDGVGATPPASRPSRIRSGTVCGSGRGRRAQSVADMEVEGAGDRASGHPQELVRAAPGAIR